MWEGKILNSGTHTENALKNREFVLGFGFKRFFNVKNVSLCESFDICFRADKNVYI